MHSKYQKARCRVTFGKIILIDNFDSFSYNLYQLMGSICSNIQVIRNNEKTPPEIENMRPDTIVISPGPGKPSDAGVCIDVIKYFKDKLPILGICLGHQAICEAFGGKITYADTIMHGKTSEITIDTDSQLFKGLNPRINVGRYHSLVAQKETLPEELIVTARCDDGTIMGVKHREYNVFGLQFHPESILTVDGKKMIENFLEIIKK